MLGKFFSKAQKTHTEVTGIRVYVLQNQVVRFANQDLNAAMQAAWHRSFDPVTFYATAIDDCGAIFKMNEAFYPLLYADRRLGTEELGNLEIPLWADHGAFTCLSAEFPGGIPDDALPGFYWLLGSLLTQLIRPSTKALYFREAGLFVPSTSGVLTRMKEPTPYLPSELVAIAG
ncbi:MAG TPA: hypothetical protein VFW30_09025 [Bryocella sp.]|nr:hypothetical protein [Bryocella sp.]